MIENLKDHRTVKQEKPHDILPIQSQLTEFVNVEEGNQDEENQIEDNDGQIELSKDEDSLSINKQQEKIAYHKKFIESQRNIMLQSQIKKNKLRKPKNTIPTVNANQQAHIMSQAQQTSAISPPAKKKRQQNTSPNQTKVTMLTQ